MAKGTWSFDKEVKKTRERLANRQVIMVEEIDRENLEEELGKGKKVDPVDLACSLSNVGRRLQTRGAVAVGSGDASGWSDILNGWTMNAWFEVVLLNNLYGGKFIDPAQFGFRDQMHVVAQGIALRQYNLARWLVNHYRTIYDQRLSDWFSSYWLFMLHLGAVWQDQPRPEPRGKTGLGPFAHVFTYWEQPKKLGPVIDGILEWHLATLKKDLPPWDFESSPFDFWPIELLALREVRAAMKLETPPATHLLGQTPLCTVPGKFAPKSDPYLAKSIKLLEPAARYGKLDWQGKPHVKAPLPKPEVIPNATPMPEKAEKTAVATKKRKAPRGPALKDLQKVLTLCGASKDDAAAFDPYSDDETPWHDALIAALAEAERVLIVDWRDEWSAALERLSEIAALGKWKIAFDESEEQIEAKLPNRVKLTWQRQEEDDFGALVKSLLTHTDKLEVQSLRGMDGRDSDTWSFVLLPPTAWDKLRTTLGEKDFKRVFVPLRASKRVWK